MPNAANDIFKDDSIIEKVNKELFGDIEEIVCKYEELYNNSLLFKEDVSFIKDILTKFK